MRPNRLPPKPSGTRLAHSLRFFRDPLDLFLSARAECGDVFRLDLIGLGSWVFLASNQAVREMYRAPYEVLDAGSLHDRMTGGMLGKDSIFNLDGEEHRMRQRIMMPIFNGKGLEKYFDLVKQVMKKTISDFPHSEAFAIQPRLHKAALEVMVKMFFFSEEQEGDEEFMLLFEQYSERGLRSPLARIPFLRVDLGKWSPWGRALRARKDLYLLLRDKINSRAARLTLGGEPENILDELILCKGEDGRLQDDSIADEVVTLLFAGHETTGNMLAWVVERCCSFPRVIDKLKEEFERAATTRGDLQFPDLARMKYVEALINESNRTRPLGPIAAFREVKSDFLIGDYCVPAGYGLAESSFLLGMDEAVFEQPEQFIPERFLDESVGRFDWNLFGGGKRICTGRGLAWLEMKIFLYEFFSCFSLKPRQDEIRPRFAGAFLLPEGGLEVMLEPS